MRNRFFLFALGAMLAALMAAAFASAAIAISWTDLPDGLLSSYGITNDQVAQISQGFGNGLWRPDQQITRGQFAKMACLAFGIAQKTPAAPTFTDVGTGSPFYPYVEGAAAAGLVNGVAAGHFAPNSYVTREQGLAIIARAIVRATSLNLSTIYTPGQVSGWLGSFSDGANVSTSLRSEVAFTANLRIVRSADGDLAPRAWLTRLMAAVFLIRAGAPSVASVTPGQGDNDGGESVTINGTGFAGATEVKFGPTDATSFRVISDTQITAVTPSGTVGTSVNVVVVNAEGSSDVWEVTYTYTYPLAVLTSVSPNAGSPNGGNTAIIDGSGFTGATAVQFGGTDATSYTVTSDTRITAVVPPGTAGQAVYVTVVGPAGTSVVDAGVCSYTYRYPAVTSVSPTHGAATGGNTVVVNGIGFSNLVGADAVRFGDDDAVSYQVQSDTKLTAVVPQGTPDQSVAVTVTGQDPAITVFYTYDQTSIEAVSLNHGPFGGGNIVTITGNGLIGVTNVYFDGQASPSVTVVSDTQVKAMVPAANLAYGTAAPRAVLVSVRTSDGRFTDWDDGWYTYNIPSVQYFTDTADAIISGGSAYQFIRIRGVGFDCGGIVAVYFGSTLALGAPWYPSLDGTKLEVQVPPGVPGSKVTVFVVNNYGSSIDSVTFSYAP